MTKVETPAADPGLSALDWLVVVAAVAALAVLTTWLFKGQPPISLDRLRRPSADVSRETPEP